MEKEFLKQNLVEVRSQLEVERADRKEIEAELSPAKAKFGSGRHAFREINTRRPQFSASKVIKGKCVDIGKVATYPASEFKI